jgi:hypothetical protein
MLIRQALVLSCFVLMKGLAQGSGSGPGGSGKPVENVVAFSIPNEAAPPGGVVQMKLMVTEPTPITSGGPHFKLNAMFSQILGIEVFNPTGDVNGVALMNGSELMVQYTTSTGAQGADYPMMTIALDIPANAAVGTQTQFSIDPSSTWLLGSLGAGTLRPNPPATVTVGGSISITDIVPGGGIVPAGTAVSIRGIGFEPKTRVQLNNIKTSSVTLISPNEIQFTVAEPTLMTGRKIQVVNPDNSQDTYFSYTRGTPWGQSNQPLLDSAVPIFSSVTHSQATFSSMTPALGNQFSGLAIQNSNLVPATVTVSLYSASYGQLGSTTFVIPAGCRMMREISELAQGATPAQDSYAVVTASQPVQAFGFTADATAGTIVPFAASSWQP